MHEHKRSHKRDPAFAHKHPPASLLPRAYAPTHWLKETPYCAETATRSRVCSRLRSHSIQPGLCNATAWSLKWDDLACAR